MKLPRITGKKVVDALLRNGFELVRITGSHHVLQHPNGIRTVIPCHAGEELGRGLLNKIIKKDLKITRAQFLQLLN